MWITKLAEEMKPYTDFIWDYNVLAVVVVILVAVCGLWLWVDYQQCVNGRWRKPPSNGTL
jgi:hypothetical protein